MILLIDPPVTSFHPPAEIEAWLDELAAMREAHAGDEEALGCIRRAEDSARHMLELASSMPPIAPTPVP